LNGKKPKAIPMSAIPDDILVKMYEQNKRNLGVIARELRNRGIEPK
jgi:hypothetical protein